MNRRLFLFLCCAVVLCLGCSTVTEPFKVIWGSSTKALEKARAEALIKTYQGTMDECMDAVVELTKVKVLESPVEKPADTAENKASEESLQPLKLFRQDRVKGLLVVMNIPGAINTTEVGIFFVSEENSLTRLEISSLSSTAKANAAQIIFTELDKHFNAVE